MNKIKMLNWKKILIILVSILLFLIALSIFQNPKTYEQSKIKIFFSMVTVVTFVLFGIGLILTSNAIEEGQSLTRTQQTYSLIDRAFVNPVKRMNELYNDCPNFISSLWPQSNIFPKESIKDGIIDKYSSILEISILLLQSFEDHFTGSKFDQTGEAVWAGNYLQWASSKKFYEMFQTLYPNFKDATNDYAKLLFEYAQKNSIKTGDDLNKVAKDFANDSRVKNLFKKL